MPSRGGIRSWAALLTSACAAAAALLLLTPALARWVWIARLALRETSLAITAVALLAALLALPARDRRQRMARWLALPSGVVGLLPFATQLFVLMRLGLPFSPLEYAVGSRPQQVRVERHLVLEARAAPLRADVHHAPGAAPHPFVVLVHGGSWRSGERGEGAHLTRAIAVAGHTVIDVEYRLAPAHPFPDGIGDLKCALGRVRERAGELGIDPDRGVLLGRSAGGQMALVAAYSAGDPRVPPSCDVRDAPVQGVIGLYSPVDLVFGHANPMRPDVIASTRSIELYLGGPPSSRREVYRLASPRSWADRPLPPTLLLHGESDRIVGSLHSALLASELSANRSPVTLVRIPFGEHGFEMRPGSVSEQLARAAILEFLDGG